VRRYELDVLLPCRFLDFPNASVVSNLCFLFACVSDVIRPKTKREQREQREKREQREERKESKEKREKRAKRREKREKRYE
jgi:hypothetical protein